MDKSSNLKLLNAIKKQLNSLEDSFYDGIPNELLNNEHLTHFSHMMEAVHSKIIILVKNTIRDVDQEVNINKMDDRQNINIDYSQLEALSKKDITKYN
jgi:hypothetical protein